MSLKIFFSLALLFFCVSVLYFLNIQNVETYKVQEQVLIVEKEDEKPIEFIVTGDIMLGRFVEVLMNENEQDYPFKFMQKFLHSVPFVIGNLEGPIVENHIPTPSLTYIFSFPSNTADLLKDNNISVVSLANNHALDQGEVGYEDTKKFLTEAGVPYFGHPISVGGISVLRKKFESQNLVFVGFNATWPYEEKEYEDLIKKESLGNNFVIVMIHWGDEYKLISNETQKRLAHLFIDAGADVVFGSHPHVVQEVEVYKNKAIFYSLGNFIFDQYFSNEVKEGLLVKVLLQDEKVSYELYPTLSPRSQPSLMEGFVKENFLQKLANKSSNKIKESVTKGSIELSRE